MRSTEQRAVILQELRLCADHPTADELYLRVKRRLPRISLATVYRNLHLLAEEGLIGRLEFSSEKRRYDGTHQPHLHFRCSRCGRVEDAPFELRCPAPEARHPWAEARRIDGVYTELRGLCPECLQAASQAERRRAPG